MKKFIFALLILSGSLFTFGQNPNPLDEKYQPPKNSIFNSNGKSDFSSSKTISERKSNSLSFLFTDLARYDLRFEYERKINETYSATGGFGFSLGVDIIERSLNFYEIASEIHSSSEGKFLTDLYRSGMKKSGYNFAIGLRRYYREESSYSSYMSMMWKMTRDNYRMPDDGYYSPTSLDFGVNLHYFTFMIGTSLRSGSGKYLFVNDFSYGFGLKYSVYDQFKETPKPVDLQTSSQDTWYQKQEGFNLNLLTPVILFRYEIGISW